MALWLRGANSVSQVPAFSDGDEAKPLANSMARS